MTKIKFLKNSLALGYYKNNFVDVSKYFNENEEGTINEIFGLFTSNVDEIKIFTLQKCNNFRQHLHLVNEIISYAECNSFEDIVHFSIYLEE